MAICSDLTEEEALCALRLHKDRCTSPFTFHIAATLIRPRVMLLKGSKCHHGAKGTKSIAKRTRLKDKILMHAAQSCLCCSHIRQSWSGHAGRRTQPRR